MPGLATSYADHRARIEGYFDRTARDAWERLTSDAPVGRIRATVRAGRDAMRATLLGWLPGDLDGARVLDAGCGTGAAAVEMAGRGAQVVAVDVAAGLIDVARERAGDTTIEWHAGDMADPALGRFHHVVAMDSLIHYPTAQALGVIASLAARTERSIVFTFAPRTPLLAAMHTVGRAFPRGDRSPAIEPVAEARLRTGLAALPEWRIGRAQRITSGFYMSHALELVRA